MAVAAAAPPRVVLERVGLTFPVHGSRAGRAPAHGRIGALGRGLVGVTALSDVSLRAGDGDRIGVLGRNGSGKTTLLRVIAGIYPPRTGRVAVRGRVMSMLDIHAGFDPDASGAENIEFRGMFLGAEPSTIEASREEIVAFSELGEFIDLPMRTYSAGMRMRLAFSIATALVPDILVMDEWLSAGDAEFRKKATERMTEMVASSRVLFMASHSAPLLSRVCNKGLVLADGRVSFFGAIGEALETCGMSAEKARADGEAPKGGAGTILSRSG